MKYSKDRSDLGLEIKPKKSSLSPYQCSKNRDASGDWVPLRDPEWRLLRSSRKSHVEVSCCCNGGDAKERAYRLAIAR